MAKRIPTKRARPGFYFVVCVNNRGYPSSLDRRKIYEAIEDSDAAEMGQVRVIDETGEDYLFPARYFVRLDVDSKLRTALKQAS